MTWTPLAHWQFARMPEPMKEARRARWLKIVAHLQADHYARYHGPRDARLVEWAQTRSRSAS